MSTRDDYRLGEFVRRYGELPPYRRGEAFDWLDAYDRAAAARPERPACPTLGGVCAFPPLCRGDGCRIGRAP